MAAHAKARDRDIGCGDAELSVGGKRKVSLAQLRDWRVASGEWRRTVLGGQTSLLPRPKPLMIGPEILIGKGEGGLLAGPAVGERARGAGLDIVGFFRGNGEEGGEEGLSTGFDRECAEGFRKKGGCRGVC